MFKSIDKIVYFKYSDLVKSNRGVIYRELKELGKLSQGLPARSLEPDSTPYSIINVRNLERLHVSGDVSVQLLKATGQLEGHRLRTGDLLISQRNQPLRASLVTPEQGGAIAGQNLAVFRPYPEIDAVYLAGLLRSALGQKLAEPHIKQSTAVTLLSLKDLGGLCVPVPSLEEQKKLAELMLVAEEVEQLAYKTIASRRSVFESILISQLGERQ